MIDITVQTPKIDIENPNRGEPGRDGIGIHYMGEINEYNDLPLTAEEGDAYYWAGKLYIFKDDEFPAENKGIQYQGPQGPEGPQGPPGKQGIQGQQGIQGEAFAISKVYKSVSEMNADFENAEVKEGQFVLINTGNIEDEDNAKLFVKGVTSYNYLTDLSGATGMTGPQGPEGPQGPPGEIAGLSGIATTDEAIAGESDTKAMTPLKTKEAINVQTQNKADLVDGKVPKDQLPGSVHIPPNSNLDTYLEAGEYHSPTDAEAATITNAPLKTAFFLCVDRANATNVKQVITHFPFDSRTFYRLYYSGEWSVWLEVARFNPAGHLVLPNGAEFWIG